MTSIRFDEIAKLLAEHRLSRRRALARGGAGLAAGALAAAGRGPAAAAARPVTPGAAGDPREAGAPAGGTRAAEAGIAVLAAPAPGATAIATPVASGAKPITFLFLQSFDSGSLTPKAGTPDRYTLTLKQGLGDTVYFSDRPAKVVGTVPTAQFLKALGFTPANPPNAALVGQRDATHKDVVVVELFNPIYDAKTNTLSYEVALLKDWHKLDETFQQTPDTEAQLPRAFTAAHLFIDDCPDAEVVCFKRSTHARVGDLGFRGMCWHWFPTGCFACDPDAYSRECNATIPACEGQCYVF